MASSKPWYRAVLGAELARWPEGRRPGEDDDDDGYTLVPVEEALGPEGDAEVVALYFPPLVGDDLTERLVELHDRVNKEQVGKGDVTAGRPSVRLRVVQVLTPLGPAASPASSPIAPRRPDRPRIQVPWFAVPPDDFERQRRVCGRYRVRPDVARLLLLDGATGRLVSRCGRERLLADPKGLDFPWPPRPLDQVLASASLRHGQALRGLGREGVIGVYFSAHWCPPCRAFTPQLVTTYNAVRERGHHFEVLFVSSDRSEESFEQYAATMPWAAVAWADETARQELTSLLAVQGIPTLVLLDAKEGALITDDARVRVNEDPDGKDFPWRPEPVSLFTERLSSRLHDHPALILFVEGSPGEVEWALAILRHAAAVYADRHPCTPLREHEPRLQFFVAQDGDAADSLREQLVLEDAVPLLVAVDVWRGAVSVLEDEADDDEVDEDRDGAINTTSAVAFMEAFLAGDLPSAPIGVYLPPPPRPHHALLQSQDALPLEA